MPPLCLIGHHGYMSAATFTPAPGRPSGATPVSSGHTHRLGDALRAVRVFAGAAFDVVILGEYGQEAGVRRK
ncbi:hypothetical protein AQI84_41310 [Streptomyces griseorubiginosus]|uniref:Uncharacterized protein n=2 Tax=Streptomyces TaxID=1883 RepID=A0A101RRZ0_9ACTN|nr:hypothetical protein DWG14_04686 [Streptomyces griseorubiginosus]KUM67182.1 hypothetical protein AQI84_41310 [Streptomyces griseorubiginosus]KUN60669.1 hypothetical protein AQJ54_36230 [Streptomyces griseorubiginosus]